MTEPTDADRKAAAELVAITGVDNHADAIAAIAAALAAERERARAVFCTCDAASEPHTHYRQVDTYERAP